MEPLAESEVVDDRYRLGAIIGRGGMADVRVAEDLRLHRKVALKSLRVEMAEQDGVRHRFQDEARAAARLSHPNVVAIFDTGSHHEMPYLVMERLPGVTLADLIDRGPQDLERVRQLGTEVLAALGAAHAAGLVHRDIKPANVLLAEDGTAKVADFGIAKSAEAQTHTAAGVLMGTAGYLPPERLAGQPATAQSDLYAVGVLLYELLTARQPFGGDSPLVVAAAIQKGEHQRLRDLRSDVDQLLVDVVERAMALDPSSRFRSAAEMAEALATIPSSAATVAATTVAPTAETRPGEPTIRQQGTEVLAEPPPSEPPPSRPPQSPRPFGAPRVLALVVLAVVLVLGAVALAGDDDGPTTTGNEPVVTDDGLPAPLADALGELEEAVQP